MTPRDILSTFIVYGLVGAFHVVLRKKFFALSFEGKGGLWLEFLFFASFAVVLVKSVRMACVLQVFSFLVIPALIGRLFSRKPLNVLVTGWLLGILVSIGGIFLSYTFDIPTAPVIVGSLSIIFFVLLAVRAWVKWNRERMIQRLKYEF